jgi:hypothetical protein
MIATETNSTISWMNKIAKYNARKSHRNITNNNHFSEYKTTFHFTIKIIPWPHARFGDVPRAVPLPSLRAASACRPRKAHRYLPAKR